MRSTRTHFATQWLVIVLVAMQLGVAQQPVGVIQGTVVEVDKNLPISGAVVELLAATDSVGGIQTTTNERGEFEFGKVQPGQYRIVGSRPGYVRAQYGQRSLTGAGTPLTLGSGEQRGGLKLVLTPAASVSGRITGPSGDPVGNADVVAFKATFPDGRRTLSAVRAVRSNDLGEYRIFWLTPGKYYIGVVGPDGIVTTTILNNIDGKDSTSLFVVRRTNRTPTVASPSTLKSNEANLLRYFPDEIDGEAARAIDLPAGADVRDVNLTARPVTTQRVRGTVLSGGPTTPVQLRLLRTIQPPFQQYSATTNSGGAFEFPNVIPGPYVLFASGGENLSGRSVLEVKDSEVTVTVGLSQSVRLPVRVTFENAATPTPGRISNLRLDIVSDPWVNGAFADRRGVPAGGELTPVLPSGDYRVFVSPILSQQMNVTIPQGLQGIYVKSIQLAGTDVLQRGLHLDRQAEGILEIVLGSRPGIIEGRVALPGAVVVLLPPETSAFRRDMYRTTTANSAGAFRFENVVPGEYRIYAWDEVETGAWLDPAFLKDHESRVRRLTLEEGRTLTVELEFR